MKRRRRIAFGLLIAASLVAVGTTSLVVRAPAAPGFIARHAYEVVERTTKAGTAPTTEDAFNVHLPFDRVLASPDLRKKYRWWLPTRNPYVSVVLDARDPQDPIERVWVHAGRYRRTLESPTSTLDDRFSEGWTAVTVQYRPNANARLRSLWEGRLAPVLRIAPPRPALLQVAANWQDTALARESLPSLMP